MAQIQEVYASIPDFMEENSGEVLQDIALLDEGSEVTFRICVKSLYGILSTYMVPLNGLSFVP